MFMLASELQTTVTGQTDTHPIQLGVCRNHALCVKCTAHAYHATDTPDFSDT